MVREGLLSFVAFVVKAGLVLISVVDFSSFHWALEASKLNYIQKKCFRPFWFLCFDVRILLYRLGKFYTVVVL